MHAVSRELPLAACYGLPHRRGDLLDLYDQARRPTIISGCDGSCIMSKCDGSCFDGMLRPGKRSSSLELACGFHNQLVILPPCDVSFERRLDGPVAIRVTTAPTFRSCSLFAPIRPQRASSSVHNTLALRGAALCSDIIRDGFRSTREYPFSDFSNLGRGQQCSGFGRQRPQHREWLSNRELSPR